MKIEQQNNMVSLEDINYGEIFLYNDKLAIRSLLNYKGIGNVEIFYINDGIVDLNGNTIKKDTLVQKIEIVKVIYK